MLIITVLCSLTAGGGIFNPAGFAVMILCAAITANLFIMADTPLILCIGFISVTGAYLLYGDFLSSLSCAFYLPVGFIIAISVKKNLERCQIVVRTSGAAACFLGIYALLYIFIKFETVSVDEISRAVNLYIENTIISTVDWLLSYADRFEYELGSETVLLIRQITLEENLSDFILSVKTILPSLIIILCNAVAYFSSALYRFIRRIIVGTAQSDKSFIPKIEKWRLNISGLSAAILFISIFLSMFMDRYTNYTYILIVSNLVYILSPGFFIIGASLAMRKMKSLFEQKLSAFVTVIFVSILLIFLGLLNIQLLVSLAVFAGVWNIISTNIKKLRKKIPDEDD